MAQRPSQLGLNRTKVGTQWFAVDAADKPTGEPLDIELAYETFGEPTNQRHLDAGNYVRQRLLAGPR